jgi:hypothetical protein
MKEILGFWLPEADSSTISPSTMSALSNFSAAFQWLITLVHFSAQHEHISWDALGA